MINRAVLIGRLGDDPNVRFTTKGDAIANLSLCTSYKTKDHDYTEWHRLVGFGKVAEIIHKYSVKGQLVYVEGRLQTRKWHDEKADIDRWTTEIVIGKYTMLQRAEVQDRSPAAPKNSPAAPPKVGAEKQPETSGDDLPF
jgi:single-strand DNA-binding protein